jgi:hypothetical protein
MMVLLSKSEIPNPKPQIQNVQAWGRSGREVAAATIRLKRVRPPALAGFAEGSPEVGWGQGGNAWGKLCIYVCITIMMNEHFHSTRGARPVLLLRL